MGDGKSELVLGRRDGTVQVFTVKSEIDFEEIEPQQLYSQVYQAVLKLVEKLLIDSGFQNFNESISVVQAGCFGFNGFPEIVVCSYSGKVFGLSTQSTVMTVIGTNNESVESPNRTEVNKRSPDVEFAPRLQEVAPRNVTSSMFEVNDSVSRLWDCVERISNEKCVLSDDSIKE